MTFPIQKSAQAVLVLVLFSRVGFSAPASIADKTGKTVYFPECHVRLTMPLEWYGYNETQMDLGIVYATKQKMISKRSKYTTGVTLHAHYEKEVGKLFSSTQELADQLLEINDRGGH